MILVETSVSAFSINRHYKMDICLSAGITLGLVFCQKCCVPAGPFFQLLLFWIPIVLHGLGAVSVTYLRLTWCLPALGKICSRNWLLADHTVFSFMLSDFIFTNTSIQLCPFAHKYSWKKTRLSPLMWFCLLNCVFSSECDPLCI